MIYGYSHLNLIHVSLTDHCKAFTLYVIIYIIRVPPAKGQGAVNQNTLDRLWLAPRKILAPELIVFRNKV